MRFPTALVLTLTLAANALGQAGRSSSSASSNAPVPCSADARWTNTTGSSSYSRQTAVPVSLNLLAHVSKGSGCSGPDIAVTATFLGENQDYICSGTVLQALQMTSDIQNFNIEIRPFSQLDFVRWRNMPGGRGIQQGKRLACLNLDGTADVGDLDRQKAGWVRLSVAVQPSGGGLAITEAMIRIAP